MCTHGDMHTQAYLCTYILEMQRYFGCIDISPPLYHDTAIYVLCDTVYRKSPKLSHGNISRAYF